jgi:YVTN family beta-propeller protein
MFLTAPLLTFDVVTDPFPLLASAESGNLNKAKLTVLAANGTGSDVTLQGILVQLPIGPDADQLTIDSTVIEPLPPANWTLASVQTPLGFATYVFHPRSGHAVLAKGQSLWFVFNNIEVNRKEGTFTVELTEGAGNCVPPHCPQAFPRVSKFPNGWGQVSFWANPANIPYQGNTTLFWSGPQGATYTIEYMAANGEVIRVPKPGDPPLANQGQYPGVLNPPLTLDRSTAFTLIVSQRIDGKELVDRKLAFVNVASAPLEIVKFHGSLAVAESEGDEAELELTLSWSTRGAAQVTLTHVNGVQKDTDTLVIRSAPNKPLEYRYVLEARNDANSISSTINITWTPFKSAPVKNTDDCAILPDGSRLFLIDQVGWSISALDPLTLANVAGSPFRVERPRQVRAAPDNSRIYVINVAPMWGSNLLAIDARSFRFLPGSVLWNFFTGAFAVTPDGKRVYAGTLNGLEVFDASNLARIAAINLPARATSMAFTPDGTRAFAVLENNEQISVIDTATLTQIATIPAGPSTAVAVTPGGKQLYIGRPSNSVAVYDPVTLQPLAPAIELPAPALALAPSADGRLMFVTCGDHANRGWLCTIDTATHQLASAETPFMPTCLAVSPDGLRVFVRNWMFLPSAVGGI